MRYLITELRLYACEWILGLIVNLAPRGNEGDFLIMTVYNYFKTKVNERTKHTIDSMEINSGL